MNNQKSKNTTMNLNGGILRKEVKYNFRVNIWKKLRCISFGALPMVLNITYDFLKSIISQSLL